MPKKNYPPEIPDAPDEAPMPPKTPEIVPGKMPEIPSIPEEAPTVVPDEAPFQPDIPDEIPPGIH
jgi:hypothetical protein